MPKILRSATAGTLPAGCPVTTRVRTATGRRPTHGPWCAGRQRRFGPARRSAPWRRPAARPRRIRTCQARPDCTRTEHLAARRPGPCRAAGPAAPPPRRAATVARWRPGSRDTASIRLVGHDGEVVLPERGAHPVGVAVGRARHQAGSRRRPPASSVPPTTAITTNRPSFESVSPRAVVAIGPGLPGPEPIVCRCRAPSLVPAPGRRYRPPMTAGGAPPRPWRSTAASSLAVGAVRAVRGGDLPPGGRARRRRPGCARRRRPSTGWRCGPTRCCRSPTRTTVHLPPRPDPRARRGRRRARQTARPRWPSSRTTRRCCRWC